MSKIAKIVNIADFRNLSQKIMKACKCEPIPLTKLDANKCRPLNAHLDQWDFYNRERLIQKQRQAEQAKMRSNLKARSEFTMNPLPDYSHQVIKNKGGKDASKLGEHANAKRTVKKRGTDDRKRGSDPRRLCRDSSKPGRHSNKGKRDSSKLGRGSSKLGRDSSKLGRDSSKLGRDSSKHGRDSSKHGRDSSKLGKDSSKLGRDSSKLGRDSNKLGRDSSKLGRDSITLGIDSSKLGRDTSKANRDSSKPDTDFKSSKNGSDSGRLGSNENNNNSLLRNYGRDSDKQSSDLSRPGDDSSKQDSDKPKRSSGSHKRRRSSSRKRGSSSKRRSSSSRRGTKDGKVSGKKAAKVRFSSPWNNPLGKTLDYITTEEYKRISPEFLKLIQERPFAKTTKSSKHQAIWKDDVFNNLPSNDKDSLDTLNPALAQYLREQMEGGNIMNKIYGIDFYTKNNEDSNALNKDSVQNNPYNAMNLEELRKVLKTLHAGGTLTEDQLKFLHTFLKSAAQMEPEIFESVMQFGVSLGIFSPKMVGYLKALIMKTSTSLTPENLQYVLQSMGWSAEILNKKVAPFETSRFFSRLTRKTRVFSQRPDYPMRRHADYHINAEDNDAVLSKKKKGYIYPTTNESKANDVELIAEEQEEQIKKFGPRPDKKNDYFNFRIKRSQVFRRGHPQGYYEPIAVDDFVLAGLNEFQRLSVEPRRSTLSKLSEMQHQKQNLQPVSPQPLSVRHKNALEVEINIKKERSGSKSSLISKEKVI